VYAASSTHLGVAGTDATDGLRAALAPAWQRYLEDPRGVLTEAVRGHEVARLLGDDALCARMLALQSSISLHRGDLRSAMALAVEAERHAERTADPVARAELAALKSQLSFFTGSYADALSHAEEAIELADSTCDAVLRIHIRRTTCVALGNIGVPDWRARLEALLSLTVVAGQRWEEAIVRNDLAVCLLELGEPEQALGELERALEAARGLTADNFFALAVLHCTRADIRLGIADAAGALDDAERSIDLLTRDGEPNPYVLGMAVRAEVQARMALGHPLDAQAAGEGALTWLGERVPQTRSLILATIAGALREAGRTEEAYDALARSAELERQAFRELSGLRLGLERATLEVSAARRESDSLASKNRELAEAHAELERRAEQLEQLQSQLRDQAERDWLTGLYNRRYLAGELERLGQQPVTGPVTLAVLDIDRFKSVNDRFGHEAGDHVLIRVSRLLCDTLRDTDIVVRSGGEEFIVLMPHTGERAAIACCERIRQSIAGEVWEAIGDGVKLTCCVGIASAPAPQDLAALLRLADQRLYEAKNSGRDRIVGRSAETRVDIPRER
jgi:diguanylate cyclase (GGDEF)-like protein